MKRKSSTVQMIAIEELHVPNPRMRNQKIFKSIAENIVKVGLKMPITVTPSHANIPGKKYDVVCGQGRMEAFIFCRQTHIPAIVTDASEEEALVMGLTENIARRHRGPLELLKEVERLRKQNYATKTIAAKIGMTPEYTRDLLTLLEHGEERLLFAVESGRIPITTAVHIVESPQNEQAALQEAYENKQINSNQLRTLKKLLEARKNTGKSMRSSSPRRKNTSVREVLKVYHTEVERKRLTIRKAERAQQQLVFMCEALKRLLHEENFLTLLRAEDLLTIPKSLSLLIEPGASHDTHTSSST